MHGRTRIVVGIAPLARRRAVAQVLRDEGYDVTEAADARQLVGQVEYAVAIRGRRRRGGIEIESFALVVSPDLDRVTPIALASIERARWCVPIVRLSGPGGHAEVAMVLGRVRAALEEGGGLDTAAASAA